MQFEIDIILKKDITTAITIPILNVDKNSCQMRHDGFMLNAELYLWEEIEKVIITPWWIDKERKGGYEY